MQLIENIIYRGEPLQVSLTIDTKALAMKLGPKAALSSNSISTIADNAVIARVKSPAERRKAAGR